MNQHAVNMLLAARQHLVLGHTHEVLRVIDKTIVVLSAPSEPSEAARPTADDETL